jgi:hypothetical protein
MHKLYPANKRIKEMVEREDEEDNSPGRKEYENR